ncbi:MAG: radical SAM protein [Deltaproteobacteria bacterium]|nr:radical SAM protein [Deltaproteobacteria bacterium]
MKRLLLVQPRDTYSTGDLSFVSHITKRSHMMVVHLPTVAALTPDGFDITIVDENLEPVPYDTRFDLVGITGFHNHIDQARVIATRFGQMGIPVVCGGPSVTQSPERWEDFSDVLIMGEAENVWPQFCRDFQKGAYRNKYQEHGVISLANGVTPAYHLLSPAAKARYYGGVVLTGRGCPHKCEFCSSVEFSGRRIRHVPIHDVVAQVQTLADSLASLILLGADNFSADPKHAKALLRALGEWNRAQKRPVSFYTELSLNTADDEEFLKLAAEAGLTRVLVGIESLDADCLADVGKRSNIGRNMEADLRKFAEYGILVSTSVIVGLDRDDVTVFERMRDFFVHTGVGHAAVWPLHAPDGAPIKERMVKEGRYVDWACPVKDEGRANYWNSTTVIPKNMTVEMQQQGLYWLLWQLADPVAVCERLQNFLEMYERAPVKNTLHIPGGFTDMGSLHVARRFFWYLLFKAPSRTRKAFFRLMKTVRRSSHPQRMAITVGAFIQIMNHRISVERSFPATEKHPNVQSLTPPHVSADSPLPQRTAT